MDCIFSFSHGTDTDLSAVLRLAASSFGEDVTGNSFVQRSMASVVDQFARLIHSNSEFTMKAVHSSLLQLGVNIKGMRKHEPLRMFVEAAFLELACRNGLHDDACDLETFLHSYPAFGSLESAEINRLFRFRNYMALAVRYINPQQNRDYLLDLITRLAEGASVRYVPGSGATLATRNRIAIYRQEGSVVKKPRVPRRGEQPRPDVGMLPFQPAVGLKRGRSLDDGGLLAHKAACHGTRPWTQMQREQPIQELFDSDLLSFSGDDLSYDELDRLLEWGQFPELVPSCTQHQVCLGEPHSV